MSEYLSILLVGPVLMVAALAMIASIASSAIVGRISTMAPFGATLVAVSKLGPFLLVILTFSFCYGFVPNTRVQASSALVGGTTAGILWTITGKLFASFVASSAQYSAIYSGFAITASWRSSGSSLPWLILLLGADVALLITRIRSRCGGTLTADLRARARKERPGAAPSVSRGAGLHAGQDRLDGGFAVRTLRDAEPHRRRRDSRSSDPHAPLETEVGASFPDAISPP
jgi:membrane protein